MTGLLTLVFVSKADEKPIKFEQLPSAAQKFIKDKLHKDKVVYVLKDDDIIFPEYEVYLESGTKVTFFNDGKLESIKAGSAGMSKGIVPQQIVTYVAANHPGFPIVEFEIDRNTYEVSLSNGIELKFSSGFQLLDVDD